jgi:hypothetical protein
MEPVQVKIFTNKLLPRLDYIASVILGDILGLNLEIVTDREKLAGSPVVNYSNENIEDTFKIAPHGLLSETGLAGRDIPVTTWKNLPVFFKAGSDSDLPFDIFAASFWLITRYEEYLPFDPDEHGRFRASLSLALRNGFLNKPVVDLWAKEFAAVLLNKFPSLVFRKNQFKALLTVDIDVPFAYLGRSLFRNMGGFLRDIISGKGRAADRYKVLSGQENDPYEVFNYIIEQAAECKSEVSFFYSAGRFSKYDKNPSWKNEKYRNLLSKITSRFNAGLHPSYYAAVKYNLLESEIDHLKIITGRNVTASRFHYLRLFFPGTLRNLIKAGITEDYSMCFHDEPGFRAGIARPFMFYDLTAEKVTGLRIVPFQVMDVTLYEYKKLDPAASVKLISKLINETRQAGGLFVSLWHNTSLTETSDRKGWRVVFESMLKEQQG